MPKKWMVAPTVVVSAALVFAACGNDDNDEQGTGDDANATTTTATQPTGEPIVVGVMSPCESQTLQFCDIGRIAEVAEQGVNAAGGIQGRPLEVVYCDDQDDPNVAAQCAQQLVNEDRVVSVVGGSGRQGGALWAAIEPAGIPWFGQTPTSPQDFSEPTSFPFGGGIAGFFNFPLVLEDTDYSSAAVVHSDTPSGEASFGFASQGYQAAAIDDVESIALAPDTVDYQPVVARLQQVNPDAWTSAQAAAQSVALIDAAADLGFEKPMVMFSATMDQRFIDVAADLGIDLGVILTFAVSEENQRAQQLQQEVEQYGNGEIEDTFSDPTVSTWLAVHVFAEIAAELDTIDSASFTDYVSGSPIDTGMTAQLDWTSPGPLENFPRIVNVYSLPGELDGDTIEQTSDEFQTVVDGAPPAVQPKS